MNELHPDTEWIAAALSPGRFLAWPMGADNTALGRLDGPAPPDLAQGLRALTNGTPTVPIVACGEAGQGWQTSPCRPPGCEQVALDGLRLNAVRGVRQTSPVAALRGEETAIAGFLRRRPGFDGILCVADQRTAWAEISAGEIVGFQTSLLGELAAGLGADRGAPEAEPFVPAMEDALSRPAAAATLLSRFRDAVSLGAMTQEAALAGMAGTLAGLELAAARPWWLGRQVALLGEDGPAPMLAAALAAQAVPLIRDGLEECLLAGLVAARRDAG
ncbi:MAG: 2-dehydro-3-deoxygalactonokinase [Paracoccaceae bacterium]